MLQSNIINTTQSLIIARTGLTLDINLPLEVEFGVEPTSLSLLVFNNSDLLEKTVVYKTDNEIRITALPETPIGIIVELAHYVSNSKSLRDTI